jgi:hypothetical protein
MLFKQAYTTSRSILDKSRIDVIKKLETLRFRREKEQEFEESLNLPSGHVIIDVPSYELIQAEPRIKKTDIQIVDENIIKKLDDFTPVAKAIRTKDIPDWIVMIITDENYKDVISKNAEKILFN